jgi:hypothetical protein
MYVTPLPVSVPIVKFVAVAAPSLIEAVGAVVDDVDVVLNDVYVITRMQDLNVLPTVSGMSILIELNVKSVLAACCAACP